MTYLSLIIILVILLLVIFFQHQIFIAMIPSKKTIILNLMVEDFCLQQFLNGMEDIGFRASNEYNLHKILASLMDLDPENIPENWWNTYCKFYEKAFQLKHNDRKDLFILANRCFKELIIINIFNI